MPLLARVRAVAPPVSPCLCPLSDVRSLCAPLRCVRVGTSPPPSGIGPFLERSFDILRRPSALAADASHACHRGWGPWATRAPLLGWRWPLHDIVTTNIVWCVAYKREVEGRGGVVYLPKSRAVVLQQCRRADIIKERLICAQTTGSKRISCEGQGWRCWREISMRSSRWRELVDSTSAPQVATCG